MRLHVISDVHGRADALPAAGAGAHALLCLGDLVLFVDYADHGRGIMADLFGRAAVSRLVDLRTRRRFAEARELAAGLWAGIPERAAAVSAAVRRQYAELIPAFPTPTFLTYGNVDVPELLRAELRPGVRLLDGETVDLDGLRVGFVGGGLRTPMRTPFERSDEEFAARLADVGAVDVLCSHIPPQLPELVYDVAAGRHERGSRALLDAIRDTQPRYCLFGHVHQPARRSVRIGRTWCLNVGHFRSSGRPFVIDLD